MMEASGTSARALLVFAKAPTPGLTKTRLIPLLGEDGAARLQQQLVHHTLKNVTQDHAWKTQLWCATDSRHPFFRHCQHTYSVSLFLQQGEDLGERMYTAMEDMLSRFSEVIIVGTDCPGLTTAVIARSFAALQDGNDVVIVPAEDGGYVLLGLRKINRNLFSKIEWGGSDVYRQTLSRIKRLGWSYRCLPILWDVDRPEDYHRLITEYSDWDR